MKREGPEVIRQVLSPTGNEKGENSTVGEKPRQAINKKLSIEKKGKRKWALEHRWRQDAEKKSPIGFTAPRKNGKSGEY